MPTNTTTRQHRVHRWFNFIAGFAPEFVNECWQSAKLGSEDLLLDPFAGCGTAPLAACQQGGRAVGFEPHPVFARIARAKLLNSVCNERVTELSRRILDGLRAPVSIRILPDAPRTFLQKLFGPAVLEQLLGAREAILRAVPDDDVAFLMLSRVVEKSSHSQTDGIYKAPTSRRKASDPTDACRDTTAILLTDLSEMQYPNYAAQGRVFERTSENMSGIKSGEASIVVTSPPYLNNFDYAEMTRMLLYFWGIANSWGEITTKVRRLLITNTTTALNGHRKRMHEYRDIVTAGLHSELDALVIELAHRRIGRAGKKEYDSLIYPYFAQMSSVLQECRRCLRRGAMIHIMVADAALYGVHIPAPQLLASMLGTIGFNDVKCELVRSRGHRWTLAKREGSTQGLGEYHVRAKRN